MDLNVCTVTGNLMNCRVTTVEGLPSSTGLNSCWQIFQRSIIGVPLSGVASSARQDTIPVSPWISHNMNAGTSLETRRLQTQQTGVFRHRSRLCGRGAKELQLSAKQQQQRLIRAYRGGRGHFVEWCVVVRSVRLFVWWMVSQVPQGAAMCCHNSTSTTTTTSASDRHCKCRFRWLCMAHAMVR